MSFKGEYRPSEDTFLLLDISSDIAGGRVLEMGCGSCFVLSNIAAEFKVGCDLIRPKSPSQELDVVIGDCTAPPFRYESFDHVIFNPPYLPSKAIEDVAVDGGREGIEVPMGFLRASLKLVKSGGTIRFILSSLSNYHKVEDFINTLGYSFSRKEKKLFYERLLGYVLTSSPP
ncbi:MAG: hypothetical protein ACP5LW_02915 [Nitrososphaeria archaeon]